MSSGVFITGTDTGVGKTFLSIGLIKSLLKRGVSVCPMKPVESGCRMKLGELVPGDAVSLLKASGVSEHIDTVNPYRLKKPLAPSVAAAIEGVKINRRKILSTFNRISRKYGLTIVEGAGGIMVPIYKEYKFLDFARDINLPVVIVSRPGLGTINHTLLTIEALQRRGVRVMGVVINYSVKERTGLSEKTNPAVIEELGGVPVIATVMHKGATAGHDINNTFDEIADFILNDLNPMDWSQDKLLSSTSLTLDRKL